MADGSWYTNYDKNQFWVSTLTNPSKRPSCVARAWRANRGPAQVTFAPVFFCLCNYRNYFGEDEAALGEGTIFVGARKWSDRKKISAGT